MAFLAVFVLGAAIFVVGSEMLIRYVAAPADDFERYRLLFRSATAPIAVFGDSQVANAIVTSPDVVNLGYPAETLPLMLFKAEAFAGAKKPKGVILQLSPQQFAIYRAENAQDEFRQELLGGSEPLLQFTRPHFRRYLLAHWQALFHRWTSSPAKGTAAPQEPRSFADWPAAEQRRNAEIRVQLHAPLPAGSATERLLRSLRDTLVDLRKRGIATCVVRYPLSEVYRKAASAVPSFAMLSSRVEDLTREQGATFVDLSDALPDRLLGDPDHVGPAGRATVTAMVIDRCFADRTARQMRP